MKVIQFDRNHCKRIRAFLDSYLNSELLVETAHEVLRHLADCRECETVLAERERLKACLQAAVRREAVPEGLSQRIQKSIRHDRRRQWSQWMIGLAALLAVAIGLTGVLRWRHAPQANGALAQAEAKAIRDAPGDGLLSLGAGDHIACALEKGFGQQTLTDVEMRAKLGPQFAALVPTVREEIAANFDVVAGHRCNHLGRQFVHLILRNPRVTLSLLLTRKRGESLAESEIPAVAEASGIKLYQSHINEMEVAGFETADYLAFVVADAPSAQSTEVALRLAPAVRDVMRRIEG